MIVEINLLGKQEKRNLAPYLIVAISMLLSLGLFLYGFMIHSKSTSEFESLEQSLQTTRQLIEIQGQKSSNASSTTSVEDLKTTIEWAKTFPTPTVYLIQHLTAQLPKRGFMMNFSYADDGTLNLAVQTDTSREIAYYMKSLLDSPYLTEASLNSISTAESELLQWQVADGEVTETEVEGDYVPRYTGQFQLKVNKEALKAAVAKEGAQQ